MKRLNTTLITGALGLALAACAGYAQAPQHSAVAPTQKSNATAPNDDNLFVWNRPASLANAINRPFSIMQSTTCRFKKGLGAAFQKVISNQEPNPPERIYYSISNEDELDTVSFMDLDTKAPKIESNGGQARPLVISDDEEKVVLLNVGNDNPPVAVEMYTIFRKKGVVIYSQQKDSPWIGPFGVLQMGYCR